MSITSNLNKIVDSLPSNVQLVAISKFHPITSIIEASNAGQKVFGESRVQELLTKYKARPDLIWHFIGHLQTNKVKNIAPFISMIQSVDSLKLLSEINLQAQKCDRVIDCLLELFIAQEDTKYGLSEQECCDILSSDEFQTMHNIRICGVMGMATYTENQQQIYDEFVSLKNIFHCLKQRFFADKSYFCEISAGMSHDYLLAIKAGSTMIRVGSTIFGERNYI